ncbi:MAG: hypothetical protein ABH954_03460 [Candidatus Omnitrophota bacterium]
MVKGPYNKIVSYLLILFLGVSLCGCWVFFVGSAVGALGGYAIGRDTIQGETDKDSDALWESAIEVLDSMDASEIDDSTKGKIQARIGTTKTIITIEQLTPNTARLKVKCRKKVLPNLTLSQKLYVRIIEHSE